jgi:MGT family glycosyltransferase
MTKFLFCSSPYYGHVNPTLPIVQELIRRGAEVVYLCSAEFQDVIQSVGATFRPYKDVTHNETGFGMESPLMFRTHSIIKQSLEATKADHADFLVYDSTCLWGKLLAEILAIPAIQYFTTYPLHTRFRPFNPYAPAHPLPPELSPRELQSIEVFCNMYHVQRFDHHTVFFHTEPLNLVFFPKEFHPAHELFDRRFTFLAPSIAREDKGIDFSLEDFDQQRIFYVSLGTIHTDFAAVYDICIHALGNQPWRAIFSIGDKIDREIFGPLPENITMYSRVPQLPILQRAEVFVTHGGMNSVMEAILHQVPLVVIPLTREQTLTAQNIEKLKLGIAIRDLRAITAYTLRKIVTQVAEDPEFRANMQTAHNMMLKAKSYKEAADVILRFAAH